jgi:hypothetical protein
MVHAGSEKQVTVNWADHPGVLVTYNIDTLEQEVGEEDQNWQRARMIAAFTEGDPGQQDL